MQRKGWESLPGLVRVHLLDRYYLPPDTTPPSMLSWLGLMKPPTPQKRVLAVLELHLRHKETDFQKLLEMTVRIRPGDDVSAANDPGWKPYCDRRYCELRAFLMGTT